MANIEKRNGKYRARVRMKGVEISDTFERKADAEAWVARTRTAILDNSQGNVSRELVFGDLLYRYDKEVTPTKRGARSESYRLGRLQKSKLANIRLTELKPQYFAKWRDSRLKEVMPDSVRREMETLSAVCERAVKEWGLIPVNPLRMVSRPKKGKPRNIIPTDNELEQVALALGHESDRPILLAKQRVALAMYFANETAMRAGEICQLTWRHVHIERRIVHLEQTKNGSSRDVPLSKKAIALLEKLPKTGSLVFELKTTVLDTLFRQARDSIGLSFRFHDIRHKALTRMAAKIEPMQLAKISGHKDLRILLNTYYNPDMGSLADLLD